MQDIKQNAPKGATYYSGTEYYKQNDYGVWLVWKVNYWSSMFQWPESEISPI